MRGWLLGVVLVVAVMGLGCGDGDEALTPAETAARAALADRGIAYTRKNYLKAAREGDLAAVELFLKAGMYTLFNAEVLHAAVLGGHLPVVKYLLDLGAFLEARGLNGATPLMWAAGRSSSLAAQRTRPGKDLELVRFLAEERGADVGARDNFGKTVLHYAGATGHLDVLRYLVEERFMNVNARDYDGYTPLHAAVSVGGLDKVKYLVKAGARVRAKTDWGMTPRDWALENYNLEEAAYLKSVGG